MYHTSAKNRAPALTACAVVDWANLKFEKTFKFRDDTCGAKHLKDFWATTGTFITALFSSGMFRTVIDFFTRKIFAIISGAPPPAEAPKGMEAGAHELHIIKTSHLGLCQAMGALLCVAKYTGCPCGWLNRALWSMAILWLFCVPVGAIALLVWSFYDGSRRGTIQFDRNPGSSFQAFFKKVWAVKSEKGAESFLNPPVVHGMFKTVLAVVGTLLTILGLKATMTFSAFGCKLDCRPPAGKYDLFKHGLKHCTWGEDEMCAPTAPEMIVFWVLGFLLNGLAILLGTKLGRKFVIAATNALSKCIGIEYEMHDETLVVKPWHTPTPGLRGQPGEMSSMAKFFTFLANVWARFNALTDAEMQKDLRCMGAWKKKDTYGMFYGDFNHNGAVWAVFLMIKNLMVGIMLTSCDVAMCSVPCECGPDAEFRVSAPLLDAGGKAWTVAVLYLTEFLVLVSFSPDNDLINGYKTAFQQMQQSIVMFVAALTATDRISAEAGAGVLVMLGTIQVALAMPEQIMGVISNFILKKGDKQSAPAFPMTPAELDLKEELAVGFQKKVYSAQHLVAKVMDLQPHMVAGDVEEVFRCILMVCVYVHVNTLHITHVCKYLCTYIRTCVHTRMHAYRHACMLM